MQDKLKEALLYSHSTPPKMAVSSGLGLLNFVLSGDRHVGICSGSVVLVSGSSCSGRTTFGVSLLSEASRNPHFAGYGMVYYDDLLHGSLSLGYIDRNYMSRLEHRSLDTVDSFFADLCNLSPSIIILDSWEVLVSLDSGFCQLSSSYINSRILDAFCCIRDSGSILIINSAEKRVGGKIVVAGGTVMSAYCNYWLRTSNRGSIFCDVGGRDRLVGTKTSILVMRSRGGFSGTAVPVPIYSSSGYNEFESIVKFLWQAKKIKKVRGGYRLGDAVHPSLFDIVGVVEKNPSMWLGVAEELIKNGMGSDN